MLEPLLFLLALSAVILAGFMLWTEKFLVPRVVGTVLPPYEVPELIVTNGVLIENRGRATARHVRVALRYPDGSMERIRNLQIIFKGKYKLDGGEQQSFLNLELPLLGAGERIAIYYSGSNKNQPQVTITFDKAK